MRVRIMFRAARLLRLVGASIAFVVGAGLLVSGPAGAQAPPLTVQPILPRDAPSLLSQHSSAVGDRLWKSGRERLTLTGVFSDSDGDVPAQLVLQLPGLCRLDVNGRGGNTTVAFDGRGGWTNRGAPDSRAEELLESLCGDAAEELFTAAAQGATVWLVGTGFRVRDPNATAHPPLLVDVYGSLRAVQQRSSREVRRKMYCFASQTRLLSRVVYGSPSGAGLVETLFEGWEQTDGQAVPSVWTRKDNGRVMFSFRRIGATFSAGANDGLFGPGH